MTKTEGKWWVQQMMKGATKLDHKSQDHIIHDQNDIWGEDNVKTEFLRCKDDDKKSESAVRATLGLRTSLRLERGTWSL